MLLEPPPLYSPLAFGGFLCITSPHPPFLLSVLLPHCLPPKLNTPSDATCSLGHQISWLTLLVARRRHPLLILYSASTICCGFPSISPSTPLSLLVSISVPALVQFLALVPVPPTVSTVCVITVHILVPLSTAALVSILAPILVPVPVLVSVPVYLCFSRSRPRSLPLLPRSLPRPRPRPRPILVLVLISVTIPWVCFSHNMLAFALGLATVAAVFLQAQSFYSYMLGSRPSFSSFIFPRYRPFIPAPET